MRNDGQGAQLWYAGNPDLATFSTNLSLIATTKRYQRDPLAFLQTLLLHGLSVAQPFLYRNPIPDTSCPSAIG